ncbi:MAG: polyphosphate kinase 1 [Bacteroidota bacterium]|nr:polyphosphate kinase 1 [Bacteroidota bacterium]
MIPLDNDRYINREISWLHFNDRVLQEALDKTVPLLERVNFLGIFSNNRDEFFRVRVATLKRLVKVRQINGEDAVAVQDVLAEISEIVAYQEAIFIKTYKDIVGELKQNNIIIINETQLDDAQGKFVRNYFRDYLRPFLFPLMGKSLKSISGLKDEAIYLLVTLSSSVDKANEEYALVKIPIQRHSRFLNLPMKGGKHYMIFLDDVIRYCLEDIFAVFGYDKFEAYSVNFTRDAELDVDNDVSKSFVELMTESVKKRKRGDTVSFLYDSKMPDKILKKLTKKLKLKNNDDIRGGGRYHNFKDLMKFPEFNMPELYYPASPPLFHPYLPINKSIFDVVREKDVMLHYPYHSFMHIVDLLREASIDPEVTAIKMTFYRTAKHSNVVNALINAARNGKKVVVYLEVQARFDEEVNIRLSQKFREEGVRVITPIPGYKVHSKLIFIRRKDKEGGFENFANISTGNFHENTVTVYADDSLLTANKDITEDVDKVFQMFEDRYSQPDLKYLIASPFSMRSHFINLLDKEIANAKIGKKAWVILKLNSLVDTEIVEKLYEAGDAGVKIKLIIRGICVLIPGIKGLSDNIECISIVDKFLEHSRVLVFCNSNDPLYYISSADWMQRNFDRRIEVACPIICQRLKKELLDIIDFQLADNQKSRIISKENPNQYLIKNSEKSLSSQTEIYKLFKKKNKSV